MLEEPSAPDQVALAEELSAATFETFFRREYKPMVALAAAVAGSAELAEDIAQEAMVRARRHWDRVSDYDKPGTWVRRATINLALSSRRKVALEAKARLAWWEPREPAEQPQALDPELVAALRSPLPATAGGGRPALPRGPLDPGDRRPPRMLGVHGAGPPASRPPGARPRTRSQAMSDHETLPPEADDEIRARLRAFAGDVAEQADTEAALERMPRRSRPSSIGWLAIAACVLAVVVLASVLLPQTEGVDTTDPADARRPTARPPPRH